MWQYKRNLITRKTDTTTTTSRKQKRQGQRATTNKELLLFSRSSSLYACGLSVSRLAGANIEDLEELSICVKLRKKSGKALNRRGYGGLYANRQLGSITSVNGIAVQAAGQQPPLPRMEEQVRGDGLSVLHLP